MQTKRQYSKNSHTAIQKLAADTIQSLECMYEGPHNKIPLIGEEILVKLKTSLNLSDITLFLIVYDAFRSLGKSTNSSTCRSLACFLFHAQEIIVDEYNLITDVIAGRKLENQTGNIKKVILENEDKLSLVDKRVILEENEKLMTTLSRLKTDLSVFKGLNKLKELNAENILTIFETVWLTQSAVTIVPILTSEYATKRIHALCDEWSKNYDIQWRWKLFEKSPQAFVESRIVGIYAKEYSIEKLVVNTSWFMAYIDPYLLITKLDEQLLECRMSTSYDADRLQRVELFLKKCMEKFPLGKSWLHGQLQCKGNNVQNDVQLCQLLLKCYIDKYISKNCFLFFGSRDPNNLVHLLPDDIKKVLQKKCLEVSIPAVKINIYAEDNQPGRAPKL